MRKIIVFALVASMGLFGQNVNAQDDPISISRELKDVKSQLEYLERKRQILIDGEKKTLKYQIKHINRLLEKGDITIKEAEKRKKDRAQDTALNIENKTSIIDNQIELVKRTGKIDNSVGNQVGLNLGVEDGTGNKIYGVTVNDGKVGGNEKDSRTESNPIVTFGVNTALVDGEGLGDSDFSLSGGYIGLGWDWTTALSKNTNFWRVRYGLEFQINKLRLKDNLAFIEDGNQTITDVFPVNLKSAKFRQINLVLPLHFEFGGAKNRVRGQGKNAHHYYNKPVFGIGGYVGFNLSNIQKLRYDSDNGRVREKTRGDFNTSDFVYGVSGYIGLNGWGLFAKYDLTPTFKDNLIEQRNFSLGVRLFLN